MKKNIFRLSRPAFVLLLLGMTVTLCYLLYIFTSIILSKSVSSSVLIHIYLPQLEHIIMSLTIIICGALTLDVTAKQLTKKE